MQLRRFALLVVGLSVALTAGASEPVLEQAAAQLGSDGYLFGLVIEQNGRMAAVSHGDTVSLAAAPFTVWVVYGDTDAVLLQVSPEPRVHDAIGPGLALYQTLGADAEMIMGMGEYDFNVERAFYLDSFAAHYLPNPRTDPRHRFNRVYYGPIESEFTAGGRDIEWLMDLTGTLPGGMSRVGDRALRELYLTAFVAEYDADYRQAVKDYLAFRIVFGK